MSRQSLPLCFKTARPLQPTETSFSAAVGTGGKWNTQLRELSKNRQYNQALILYRQMLRSGATPNAFTFPFVLKSSASLSVHLSGKQLHCHVVKAGCLLEPFVQTALISMYCKFRLFDNAHKVFDEIPESARLTVCYNALLSGLIQRGLSHGLLVFHEMRAKGVPLHAVTILGLVPGCTIPLHLNLGSSLHCLVMKHGFTSHLDVANCFLSMYARCDSIESARRLFDEIPERNLITWNAMISGYSQSGLCTQVLDLFRDMQCSGFYPDEVTLVGVLSSCANLGEQRIGREVEEMIKLRGYGSNPFVRNSLISMYARCGDLVMARANFDAMAKKTVVSWTAIIVGYGMHGQGEVAVELFDQMIEEGIRPDKLVFVCVLNACSHAGLTEKGLGYFYSMQEVYSLSPLSVHYACVVDLLGRAGRLGEALNLIESMPVQPEGHVWGALLGACKIHKNVELAELAFNKGVELEPANIGYYVLLSNIYSEAGDMEGVGRIRVMMRERGLKKDPGFSYVEHEGKNICLWPAIHATKEMYVMLRLENLARKGGEGENPLHYKEILVVKNLRIWICGEAVSKFVVRLLL
uniref:Pentatricopeptide repeat protein n=1 Tax=Salvia miltiorrhiza TaxID=226208 RepID=A0A678WF48_SALMI|nr:pentatricopeptide repeat protein [Salvia miltiorrhiza]